MKRPILALLLALLIPFLVAADNDNVAAPAPVENKPRVLIISIDGLRPDLIYRAKAEHLIQLMDTGAFSLWAETTPAAITLPSHVSMLTGVTIERHGITGNDDKAAADETLKVPSIFEMAKNANITTGMAAGKSKFSIFSPHIDHPWTPKSAATTDDAVAGQAVNIIRQFQPQLMFIHLAQTDAAGHGKGWGSKAQLEAVSGADKAIGMVLDELTRDHLRDSTYIIISADHGGAGKVHGKDHIPSRTIPWILNGPNVKKGLDLSQFRELTIRTYDTFATAATLLKIPVPTNSDGKNIAQAFDQELLQDK